MRSLLAAALTAATLTLFTGSAAAVQYGAVVATSTGAYAQEAADAKDLGVGWASIYVPWAEFEPADNQYTAGLVEQMHARLAAFKAQGLMVFVNVLTTPAWASGHSESAHFPPSDPQAFADFMTWLTGEFGSQIDGYGLGNEPNGGVFWLPGPDPNAYAAFANAGGRAVRLGDPSAKIFAGNTTGADDEFIGAALAAGMNVFDVIGFHSGTACLTDPPGTYYREPNADIGNFSPTGYRDLIETLRFAGIPEWLLADLERGWSTAQALCDRGANKGRKPAGVSEALQSQFLPESLRCSAADDKLAYVFVFSLHDHGTTDAWDDKMGLIAPDGRRKPAFGSVKSALANPITPFPTLCGGYVDHEQPAVGLAVKAPGTLPFGGRTLPAYIDTPLQLTARGTDPHPVTDVDLFANGTEIPTSTVNGAVDMIWQGSKKLPYGVHKFTAGARDEAGNVGRSATVEVLHADPAKLPAMPFGIQKPTFSINGRTVTVKTVFNPGTNLVRPSGRVQLIFEYLGGAAGGSKASVSKIKKRKKLQQKYSLAPRAGTITKKVKLRRKGRWAVQLIYKGAKPFKAAKTKRKILKIRK